MIFCRIKQDNEKRLDYLGEEDMVDKGMSMLKKEKLYGQEYYTKFREKLKSALEDGKVFFNQNTEFKYDKYGFVYRGIERENNTIDNITIKDFLSYAELGKNSSGKNIKIRGIQAKNEEDIGYYSCSLYNNKKSLEIAMNLPRKNRFIIKGHINDKDGARLINSKSHHVDLWVYKDAKIYESFEVEDNE